MITLRNRYYIFRDDVHVGSLYQDERGVMCFRPVPNQLLTKQNLIDTAGLLI